jgi:hypothetical protein
MGDVDKDNPHEDEVDLADNVMLILRSLELSNTIAPKSPCLARQLSVFGDRQLALGVPEAMFEGLRRMQNSTVNAETTIYTGSVCMNSVDVPTSSLR